MQRRKDNKGRVLKDGESQRKDGRYQYRYMDSRGKRHTIYDLDLKTLREKETAIQKDILDGINSARGEITVSELVQKYISLKKNLKKGSEYTYLNEADTIGADEFGRMRIGDVKTSDAKAFCIRLHDDGKKRSTVELYYKLLKPAFRMAVEEDAIRKNPFEFKLADILSNDSKTKDAMTKAQQKSLLIFLQQTPRLETEYHMIRVLIGTGLRVGEFCGLNLKALDFEKKRIHVVRQLCYRLRVEDGQGRLYIEDAKTEKGNRIVPMSKEVEESLRWMVKRRRHLKTETIIDGVSGFLMLRDSGLPMTTFGARYHVDRAMKAYNKQAEIPIHNVTPHTFRHTFCTNLTNGGMGVKDVQYLMGHADPAITLRTYSHESFEHAEQEFRALFDREKAV